MTDRPERPDDSDPTDAGRDHGLDVDAAFREIVENYGPVAPAAPVEPPAPVEDRTDPDPPPADPERLRGLFRPAWDQPDETDEHYVPPPPPPLPTPEPRRRLAWIGLFGSPTLMLIAIVGGIALPGWLMFLLAGGFVGGFLYLVATMDDSGRGHWPGDDGAVI
jgi:hypothetical protein